MVLDAFKLFHVALSLMGIASGIAVTASLLAAKISADGQRLLVTTPV